MNLTSGQVSTWLCLAWHIWNTDHDHFEKFMYSIASPPQKYNKLYLMFASYILQMPASWTTQAYS